MVGKNTLTGLGYFTKEIIHLISIGKNENNKEIEAHFISNDLVEYLGQKYDEFFFIKFDNKIYDNEELNKYFSRYSGVIEGREGKEYGIMKDDDGLLLVLALIADKLEVACRTLTAEY